jgi:hypothetical protein
MRELFEQVVPDALQFIQKLAHHQDDLRAISPYILIRTFIGMFFSYVLSEQLLAERMPPEMRENGLAAMIDIYLHGVLKHG